MAQAMHSKTQFGYRRHPDQDRPGQSAAEHPVVVVGAGPVGLSLAIDLAQRGQPVVLLDDADRIGEGSRAICFSKRSLEYLGPARRRRAHGRQGRGVEASARSFTATSQLYQFDLLPEEGHKRPAFINLQQYLRRGLSGRSRRASCPTIDLRWRNKVIGARAAQRSRRADDRDAGRALSAATRNYVVACDGARSSLRQMVGADFAGPGVRGPVPDRRRQDDGGISDRALVLVRSAVPCRPLGAAAQAARRHLAHRPAARSATPIRSSRRSRRTCGRGSRACSATTSSSSNGSRSTTSSAGGWSASSMAA